jgi:hypothetical protein
MYVYNLVDGITENIKSPFFYMWNIEQNGPIFPSQHRKKGPGAQKGDPATNQSTGGITLQ